MNESPPLVKYKEKQTLLEKLAGNPPRRHEQDLYDQDSDELPHDTRTYSNGRVQARRPLVMEVSEHEMSDDELYVGTSPVLNGDRGTSKNVDNLHRGENRLPNGKVGVTQNQLIDGESSGSELEDDDKIGVRKLMQKALLSPFIYDADSDVDTRYAGSSEADINKANFSATNGVHSSSIKHDKEKMPHLYPTSTDTQDSSPISGSQSSIRSYSSATMSVVQNLHVSTKEARKRYCFQD